MLASPVALVLLVVPAVQRASEAADELGAGPPSQTSVADDFGARWYDGHAEVNGYRWSGTRYGELRSGEAVAIFVTETMSAKDHLKVDREEEHDGETFTALKLNLVRDFQTGIYDYDTMTTVFVRVEDIAPVKLSFASTEWCGNVYEELDLRPTDVQVDVKSYFQGETSQGTLVNKQDGIVGDQLLVWLRGLRGPVLALGETRTLPYVADAFERRLRHSAIGWGELTVTLRPEIERVEVPAGAYPAHVYELAASDGRTGTVAIGVDSPHLLLSWEWQRDGEVLDAAVLTGSERLKYWELQARADAAKRAELGLLPVGTR
jgi:hypothetical protein